MRIRRNKDVIYRIENNKEVLFDPTTGELYNLNETASTFWALCDGRSFADIVSGMQKLYSTNEKILKSDVRKLLSQFIKKRLVTEE